MAEMIHEFAEPLHDAAGSSYAVSVWGEQVQHVWHGWLQFVPLEGGPVLWTARETTQPNREALEYWALGLEPVFREGALARAQRLAYRATLGPPS